MMDFNGLNRWPDDYEQVECWIGDRVIDLRNSAYFAGFTYHSSAENRRTVVVEFDLVEGLGGRIDEELCRVQLRFVGVSAFQVEEVVDEFVEELGRDLDHWDYFEGEHGRGVIEFEAGGMRLSFTALEVALRLVAN